jgi:hypothetical protein
MTEAHVRIDKGVKRGPKIQRRPGPGKLRRNDEGKVQAIPDGLNPKEVLDLYLTEETTSQIAARYGVRRKSLVAWLRQVAPEEWRAVQLIRAHDRKEIGNEQLEDAPDALSLARARELVKSAQWDLQALDPDYRPKQEVTVQISDLGDRLRRAKERVIDASHQIVSPDEQKAEKPMESVEGKLLGAA